MATGRRGILAGFCKANTVKFQIESYHGLLEREILCWLWLLRSNMRCCVFCSSPRRAWRFRSMSCLLVEGITEIVMTLKGSLVLDNRIAVFLFGVKVFI